MVLEEATSVYVVFDENSMHGGHSLVCRILHFVTSCRSRNPDRETLIRRLAPNDIVPYVGSNLEDSCGLHLYLLVFNLKSSPSLENDIVFPRLSLVVHSQPGPDSRIGLLVGWEVEICQDQVPGAPLKMYFV
jgi:hypothetical protein